MIKLNIQEIADAIQGELHTRNKFFEIEGVGIDSRTINATDLYIPIIGEKFNGHDFMAEVQAKGVKTVVSSVPLINLDLNVIYVKDTLQALHALARYYLKTIQPKIIAITGSNGKTSIKDILKNLLATKYVVHATKGNMNNDIGLPLTVLEMNPNCEVLILEMGMENFNEISVLSKLVNPNIAIISNIGSAHIKNLGTRANIAKAKLEILDGLVEDGLLVVNQDEPLLKNKFFNTLYYKVQAVSNFYQDMQGIHFDYDQVHYDANLFGKHQVENIIICVEIAKKLQIPVSEIQKTLNNLIMTKMRNDFYEYQDVFILDDSYKSNPESLEAAIQTLSEFKGCKIAVLSDMLELGEEEIKYHQDVALLFQKYNIDKVYYYGSLSKYSYDATSIESYYYEDKQALAKQLAHEQNCVILFKASRGMKMEEVIEKFKEMKI